MGARGSCNVCFDPRRAQIDAARAGGMPVATIARTFSIATTTLGRHFKHARPKPRPAPVPKVTGPVWTREEVEKVAAELGIPFVEMLGHVIHCLKGDVSTATDEEACELVTLLDGHPHEHA